MNSINVQGPWYRASVHSSGLSQRQACEPQLFKLPANMEFSQQSNGVSMNYATSAPATAGGQAQGPVRFSVLLVSLHLVSE